MEGVRPYTPLELAGRNIYVREGCYLCHSQMIRPLRDEVERYGHYSLAAESMYDHPFQWGSKRTGPDLARVGGKYSDEWHVTPSRSIRARSCRPRSCRAIGFLGDTDLDYHDIAAHLKTNRAVGVPYTDEQIDHAATDLRAQANPDDKGVDDFLKRYPKAIVARLRRQARADHRDGRAGRLSADARHPGRLQALRRQGRSALTGAAIMQTFITDFITTFWTPIFVVIFLGILGLRAVAGQPREIRRRRQDAVARGLNHDQARRRRRPPAPRRPATNGTGSRN